MLEVVSPSSVMTGSATISREPLWPVQPTRSCGVEPPRAPAPGILEAADNLLRAVEYYRTEEFFEAVRSVTIAGAWPDPIQGQIAENIRRALDAGHKPEIQDFAQTREQEAALIRIMERRPTMQPERTADDLIRDSDQRNFRVKVKTLCERLGRAKTSSDAARIWEESQLCGDINATPSYFVNLSAWRDLAAAPVPWAFDGTIPDRAVTVLAAPGGSGKSLFAVGLTCAAILGRAVFPALRPARAMPVLYLSGEDSAEMVCRRVAAFERVHNLSGLDTAIPSFHLRAQRPEPFLSMPAQGMIEETPAFRELLEEMRRLKPGLVVVDTLRKHFGLTNENDNVCVGAFLESCAKLAREGDCAVLVLAHTNTVGGSDPKASQGEVRGGSAAVDEARAAFVLKRLESGGLSLANVKQNYGPLREPMSLEFVDGALRQTTDRRDPADLVEIIMGWFQTHPAAAVTLGGVSKGPGDGKSLCDAVRQHFPWAGRKEVAEGVEIALANGYLREVTRKQSDTDRHPKMVLEIGSWPPDDTPF